MTTQRKISHLLASAGSGRDFHYLPHLQAAIDLSQPVIVTEKADGSTMQALGGAPYKRYDRFSKGDPRKHGATEDERYELRACSSANPAEQWYLAAFNCYQIGFERVCELEPDTWVYFEALGEKIGARYPALRPTILVFDTAGPEGFRSFDATRKLAADALLPTVHHEERTFGSLEALFEELREARAYVGHGDTNLVYACEGWVLRQGDTVAKIRVGDLERIKR